MSSITEDGKHRNVDEKNKKPGKEHEGDNENMGLPAKRVAWNDIPSGDQVSKIRQQLPRMSPERLDEDFFTFSSQIHQVMNDGQLSHKQFDVVNRWLNKLMTGIYPDVPSKRDRNIYFSNLLLQIADGALSPPLLMPPPEGPLPNASIAFQLSNTYDPSRMKTVRDKTLNPKDYTHTSKDGRTYMATKALDGSAGTCAYIGVSVGGDKPTWIKPTGEETCVPEREDLVVMDIEGRGDTAIFKEASEGQTTTFGYIASKRKSKNDREWLIKFYNDVLAKIKTAKSDANTEFDGPADKLLQKLLHTTRCEMKNEGAQDAECTFPVLMDTLERKINLLHESALRRDEEVERITNQTIPIGNEPRLIDLSLISAFDPTDDIWKAAVTVEPSSGVVNRLNKFYPECVVQALLMLLERQRQIVIDQEKKIYEQQIKSMKAELLMDVKENVVAYKRTQREYRKLMQAIQVVQTMLNTNPNLLRPVPVVSKDDEEAERNLLLLTKQINSAQKRMELARQATLNIEEKIDEAICRIADFEKRNNEADEALKAETVRWSDMICQMNANLKNQENEIKRISGTLNRDYQSNEDC